MVRAFTETIKLQLAKFGPDKAREIHIRVAKQGKANFLAADTGSPAIKLEVDGHSASNEEQVRAFGIIAYRISRMREVAQFALDTAHQLSPVKTGRYQASWFVMVHGSHVPVAQVQSGDVVVVINDQPYHAKMHFLRANFKNYLPPGIAERLRQLVLKKYGSIVTAKLIYPELAGGHSHKGRPIIYPAVEITPKFQ